MTASRFNAAKFALLATAAALASPMSGMQAAEAVRLQYSRDVRPILADNCFNCHGQDAEHREAGLRLDVLHSDEDETTGAEAVISPGAPDESELIARITSDDPELRMPPADSGKSLKPAQI